MSVLSVSLSRKHNFSKKPVSTINLLPGLGVEGDCHSGKTVQHRSRLHIKPPPLNLRQVHLIPSEMFNEFAAVGNDGKNFYVEPGQLGENITTTGVDLLRLSKGTKLHFLQYDEGGWDVVHPVIMLTGLRNPGPQIDKFWKGLRERCLLRDQYREVIGRKAGVMSIVVVGGEVKRGASIYVEEPAVFETLECV